MRCPSRRVIGRPSVLVAMVALAFLAILPAPAARARLAGHAEPVYGISVTPLTWSVTDAGGGERRIEGFVVRGVSLHVTTAGQPRPLRMVLMPADGAGGNGRGHGGQLEYGLFTSRTPSGECMGIDLRTGAALVDLGAPADAAHAIVAEAIDLGRAPQAQSGPDAPPRRDAQLGFFRFWPMIITHSIVAGAEGTRLLVVVPPKADHADATTLASLVKGDAAEIDWKGNPGDGVRLRADEKVCITTTGDRNSSAAADERQRREMAETLKALRAGWAKAFPDDRP